MLKHIQLTNFRRHTSTSVDFTPGLMVLRGSNEAGKTTIIEAVCYALFGVKVLREPLEATVTYGEPVNSLKVVLTLDIDGVEYTVKRGKSGAEVTYGDDGRVTGQTETTKFLCNVMRVDADAALRLMLANQGEIRGALEAGTKATTDLIERLSEFDQIDLLIERMQERLTLGNTSTLEAQIADLGQRLEAARAKAIAPDTAGLEAQVVQHGEAEDAARQALDALDGEVQQAQARVDQARAKQADFDAATRAVRQAEARLNAVKADADAAKEAALAAMAGEPVGEHSREELRAGIEALDAANEELQTYNRVKRYLGRAGDGTSLRAIGFLDLKALIRNLESQIDDCSQRIEKLQKELAVAEAGLTSGSCGFCGQDFSNVPAVAAKNAETLKTIEGLKVSLDAQSAAREELRQNRHHAVALREMSAPALLAIESNPQHLRSADSMLPPLVEWAGTPVDKLDEIVAEHGWKPAALKAMDEAVRKHTAAIARAEQAQVALGRAVEEHAAAALAARAVWPADVDGALAARAEVEARRKPLQVALQEAQRAKQDAVYALRDAVRIYQQAQEAVAQLEAQVAAGAAALKAQEFNNALLKRVRQCRPAIADKLWTIVLSAVSGYFSELRGTRSRVTKDLDGFKVDGHSIGGLSGSTLDILGLAIRVALVRTFLPNIPFLVLDEPCAAMDQTRTEATLGFVVACGFKQVLVVTHEDTSESVADTLIELGA